MDRHRWTRRSDKGPSRNEPGLTQDNKAKHSLHWYKFSEPDIGLTLTTARSLPKDVKPRGLS
jgi:hypothetical protein